MRPVQEQKEKHPQLQVICSEERCGNKFSDEH